VARAYTGSSSREAHVSTRQAILALAAAVFISLDYPWKERLRANGRKRLAYLKKTIEGITYLVVRLFR